MNAVIAAVGVMLILSLSRVHVVIALIVGALVGGLTGGPVSYTHLTLPTTPYV